MQINKQMKNNTCKSNLILTLNCQTPLFSRKINMMNKFFLLLGLIGLSFSYATHANAAAAIADQPCDAQYWRQMSSRAWMEAEREIMQNQNLIFKPDSVLEYVCFDQFVSLAAYPGGKIFSHTNYFGEAIIQREDPQALNKVLTDVVLNALTAYRQENFLPTYLGGRAGAMSAANSNSEFAVPGSNVSYTCTTMADVWKTAKCSNFVDNAAFATSDGFYPLKTLQGYDGSPPVGGYDSMEDVRQFPTSMACNDGNSGDSLDLGYGVIGYSGNSATYGTLNFNNQNSLSSNTGDVLYPQATPLGLLYKNVSDRTSPVGEQPDGTTLECAEPIFTGVTVVIDDDDTFADGVCTNPGCVYTRDGETGTCEEAGAS